MSTSDVHTFTGRFEVDVEFDYESPDNVEDVLETVREELIRALHALASDPLNPPMRRLSVTDRTTVALRRTSVGIPVRPLDNS